MGCYGLTHVGSIVTPNKILKLKRKKRKKHGKAHEEENSITLKFTITEEETFEMAKKSILKLHFLG